MAKQKYEVLTPIKHNKKRHEPGKVIELDDDEAEPLLAVKAIKAPEKPAEKK